MNYEILEAIGQIAREKNVSKELVLETLEAGLLSAAKKHFGTSDNVYVRIDPATGETNMSIRKKVVEEIEDPALEITLVEALKIDSDTELDSEVEIELDFLTFGRNAIQAAKQMLIQKIREAERDKIYENYVQRVGEVVTGTVQQILRGDIIINLGQAEAVLLYSEQIHKERYHQGSPVRAIISDVQRLIKGPQIFLSRTTTNFLVRLFEIEVPEIYEGIVEIKGVAREPGERSKIAVASTDGRIDPVGACVGIKGSRVQAIVRELSNERIDIIHYSDDSSVYITRALAPADVLRVEVDRKENKLTAIVDEEQLSLAIGKGGQNARLASQLMNVKVDIITLVEYQESELKKARSRGLLLNLGGVGEKLLFELNTLNITSIQDIAESKLHILTEIKGVGEKKAEKIIEKANIYMEKMRETIEENEIEE